MIVSISGMDHAGKSTQCEILNKFYPDKFVMTLHLKNMPSFDITTYDEEWWFKPGNIEEFTNVIYKCLKERIDIAKKNPAGIVLFDKGTDFYDSRVVATLIMKGLNYNDAIDYMQKIKVKYIPNDCEDLKLYLESGHYRRSELDFSNPNDVRYHQYIEINKLVVRDMKSSCIHIPANDIRVVTSVIIGCIDYNTPILETKKIKEKKKERKV